MLNFKKNTNVEESEEFTKTGVLPTGAYEATVLAGYITKAPSKKDPDFINLFWNLKIRVNLGNGKTRDVTQTQEFIAKQNVNTHEIVYFYEAKDSKKRIEYIKFSAVNRLLKTLIGQDLFSAGQENITIPVWDFNAKKEVPTTVLSIKGITGVNAKFGLVETHDTGSNNNIIKFNDIVKAWAKVNDVYLSAKEIEAGVTEQKDLDNWLKYNEGSIKDNTSKASNPSFSSGSSGTKAISIS